MVGAQAAVVVRDVVTLTVMGPEKPPARSVAATVRARDPVTVIRPPLAAPTAANVTNWMR